MKLITDYVEAYDALFDGEGLVFERTAYERGGLSKRQCFELFEKLAIPTPFHGTVKSMKEHRARNILAGLWPEEHNPWIVVYQDEYGHYGEGKLKVRLMEAEDSLYSSEFIPTTDADQGSISYRMVRFGGLEYWLRYTSKDWRSNIDYSGLVISRRAGLPLFPGIDRILWGVDFLPSNRGLLAMDFNTCPYFDIIGKAYPEDRALYMDILEETAELRPAYLKQF